MAFLSPFFSSFAKNKMSKEKCFQCISFLTGILIGQQILFLVLSPPVSSTYLKAFDTIYSSLDQFGVKRQSQSAVSNDQDPEKVLGYLKLQYKNILKLNLLRSLQTPTPNPNISSNSSDTKYEINLTDSNLITSSSNSVLQQGKEQLNGTVENDIDRSLYRVFQEEENGQIAKIKGKKPRILCAVVTAPTTHQSRAIHVKKTWGRRCDKLLFISSAEDNNLGSIALPVNEGRQYLWSKTFGAFKMAYKEFLKDADWFMKADDDTYVVMENLKGFLSSYDINEPLYFGYRFKAFVDQGYMSGGGGYIISKAALKKIGENFELNSECSGNISAVAEDVQMGKCLEAAGVKAGDSRDSNGRHRFMTFSPDYYMVPGNLNGLKWFQTRTFYPQEEGIKCCSNTSITFHYVSGEEMYVLEYLIYHLRLVT